MGERFRIGVDIGGTFTDIVFLADDGELHTRKVSSTVDDYARGIVEGVAEVFANTAISAADISEVLHGTTVASNAILELAGALDELAAKRVPCNARIDPKRCQIFLCQSCRIKN